MGMVKAEITLVNLEDVMDAQNRRISDQDVRRMKVNALVDSGAWTLVIKEAVRVKLGLKVKGSDYATLANGGRQKYNLAGPLEVWWKDRRVILDALVMPDGEDALLGAIPLNAMDLIIDPRGEELIGAHGDQVMHILCKAS